VDEQHPSSSSCTTFFQRNVTKEDSEREVFIPDVLSSNDDRARDSAAFVGGQIRFIVWNASLLRAAVTAGRSHSQGRRHWREESPRMGCQGLGSQEGMCKIERTNGRQLAPKYIASAIGIVATWRFWSSESQSNARTLR
jgi:hypothetical protein